MPTSERDTPTAGDFLTLPQPRANSRLGAWLCAHPVGEDLARYRRRHHLHHRHTQQERIPISRWPPRGRPARAPGAGWRCTTSAP